MICNNCGAENSPEASVCVSCGGELKAAESTHRFMPEQPIQEGRHPSEIRRGSTVEIVVIKGPGSGQSYPISGGSLRIGRDPGSDIFLNDVTVSREHAVIGYVDELLHINDAGSLNGTYVDGARVESANLGNGSELWVGRYKLVVTAIG